MVVSAAGSPARAAAHRALTATLRRKRPLDLAIEESLAFEPLEERDAGFARAIASETVRRFGQLDDLIRHFVPRAPPPHRAGPTLEILLAGACELVFLGVAPHAAVDGANRLAAADPKAVHFKALINAVLRQIAREGEGIVRTQDAPRLATPDWLWSRWCECYGEQTVREISFVHAQTPPLDLHCRESRGDFPGGVQLPNGIVRLEHAGRVEALPGYTEGNFWVQDFAASLPVRLLGDVAGRHVIDLCAAPGGKAAQLAAAGATVTGVERDAERLQRLAANLDRLKLSARLVEADARDFRPENLAGFVLLDAPCSATGTIRRHPDLPWTKSAGDVGACTDNAGELLESAAAMVAPGGVLVFAVCSLEAEEGPEQIAHFLGGHAEFRRLPVAPDEVFGLEMCVSAEGDLRTLPCHLAEKGGMDGFYAARLTRS